MKRETLERPAFLMYAANILAKREFRSMTLSERGLWINMVLECWPNQEIPAQVEQLSDFLGCPVDELRRLLPKVMWYFDMTDEDIFCPSLEKYRAEQDERIAKQAAGGRRGAEKTNRERNTASKHATGTPQVPRRVGVGSLDQIKSNQNKPSQPIKKELPADVRSFVADMERSESGIAANEYKIASNGG